MTEYNLNFFEAMQALKDGKMVENCPNSRYQIIEGKFVFLSSKTNKPFPASINVADFVEYKWRIVEPESWLDTTLKSRGDLDPCYKVGFQDGAKELAREAIKRIEAEVPKEKVGLNFCGRVYAIKILKELIGEAK